MELHSFIPYVYVFDLEASIRFYSLLGMAISSERHEYGQRVWVTMAANRDKAEVMLRKGTAPINPKNQDIFFYCHVADVKETVRLLDEHGVKHSKIHHPDYMPAGQCRVADPDGYVLLIGQLS